jgi:hypothetical protein
MHRALLACSAQVLVSVRLDLAWPANSSRAFAVRFKSASMQIHLNYTD